jgi:flagellin-like hook-associated protein FlgL
MQVNNNISAFSVVRSYTDNVAKLRKSMSKLSTGLRIQSTSDDPSGLAMSERLRAQSRNTAAAASNVENKINYLQTADAWLQKIHDLLGRMNELAVMANDGTKSKVDRDNLEKEFEQMQKEIQRITTGATAAGKFNGIYLFRGGTGVPLGEGDLIEGASTRTRGVTALSSHDGSTITASTWTATYDEGAQTWTFRNETTGTVEAVVSAAPTDGVSVDFEGPHGFRFTIDAPRKGSFGTNDVFRWTNVPYVPPTGGATSFRNTSAGGASGTASQLGTGSGITSSSWSATYHATTRLWTIRNETAGVDVTTISAAPNASGYADLEGPNGFRYTIHAPTSGSYATGDRFTWTNTAYSPPPLGPSTFSDEHQPTLGNSTTVKLGDGSGITSGSWRAMYDSVSQTWTVRNLTTATDVGAISAAPNAGGALYNVEGLNSFDFTIAAPAGGTEYTSGDQFNWTTQAYFPPFRGAVTFTDTSGATTGTATTAQLGDGSSISTSGWRAQYDATTQQWTIRNISTGVNVGTINAAPNAGGFINLEGANGFRFTLNAPTSGVYTTGDQFTWSNSSQISSRAGPPWFVDSSTPTVGSSTSAMLGDGSSVTTAQWRATYNAVTQEWTLRNFTTGVTAGTISTAPNAGGFIDLEGANGFRCIIDAPTSGVYNTGDQFTFSNAAHAPYVPPVSTFTAAPAPSGSASVLFQGDGYDISSATWRATYDANAQQWTIRNMTTGVVHGTIAAAPTDGAGQANIEGIDGFSLNIAALSSGSYSTGDYFEWTNAAHQAAVAGVADYTDFATIPVSLQIGPDSNQVFKETEIVLEADYYKVIGSYNTYRYGSINMTLLGSTSRAVTWASLICPQHVRIEVQSMAQAAISKLNLGIDYLSSIRSMVGAEMNRMDQTLTGLRNYEENIRATESRIRDVDVARETSELAKQQILTQVGTAMLAQANTLAGSVMNLIG